MLEGSSFFSKCSKLGVYFRNAIKNREKAFRFRDNCVLGYYAKFCILRQEYIYSAVNVLTNSVSDLTKTDFLKLNLSQVHGKIW